MTFYTTGEVDAQALAMLLKERDELRTALKERDAELAELKTQEPAAVKNNYPHMHMVGPTDGGYTVIDEITDVPVGAKLYLAAGAQPAHDEFISNLLTNWKTGLVCGQDAMVLMFRHYSSNPSSMQPAPKQDECWCDAMGIGKPGVSCGDCPKDYAEPVQEHKALSDRQIGEVIDEVARASAYGHHHTGRWMEFARAIEAKIKEQK